MIVGNSVEKVVDETEVNRLRKELAEAQVQVADCVCKNSCRGHGVTGNFDVPIWKMVF